MTDITVNTQSMNLEVAAPPPVNIEVRQGVKGDKGDKGDPGEGGVPTGGVVGQVLAKTASGPAWASFEDLTGWFENQLL